MKKEKSKTTYNPDTHAVVTETWVEMGTPHELPELPNDDLIYRPAPKPEITLSEIIAFLREFNQVSAYDLDDILEYLQDLGYLSESGVAFKTKLWNEFIKK
jgi:hypothetical protein